MSFKYFPFIRAKQFDVIAVARMATTLAANGKILPIFEPVKDPSTSLIKNASAFAKSNLSVGFVLNPEVGDFIGSLSKTTQIMASMRAAGASVIPAFSINAQTKSADIVAFYSANPGPVIFMHWGTPSAVAISAINTPGRSATHVFLDNATSDAYQKGFAPGSRVLLRDGFASQTRNANYPPQSFFGDLHLNYASKGYDGFGDFTTVGYNFSVGGGPAYAVAIHMTEDAQSQGINCKHFLSTSNLTPTNPAGKFGEAVSSLATYCQQNPGKINFSVGCNDLLSAHTSGTFPGLGTVKRLSIQHHLELMSLIV